MRERELVPGVRERERERERKRASVCVGVRERDLQRAREERVVGVEMRRMREIIAMRGRERVNFIDEKNTILNSIRTCTSIGPRKTSTSHIKREPRGAAWAA